ncbi:hypothetical protein SRHO_G00273360 [Serrasalmus rhombeus]
MQLPNPEICVPGSEHKTVCHVPVPWALMTAARASRTAGQTPSPGERTSVDSAPTRHRPHSTTRSNKRQIEVATQQDWKQGFVWAQSLGPIFLLALAAIIGSQGMGTCQRQ